MCPQLVGISNVQFDVFGYWTYNEKEKLAPDIQQNAVCMEINTGHGKECRMYRN